MAQTRYSRQREAILSVLRARCDHPTAEAIYHSLRAEHPNISLGTVYRNLSLLEGQGDVLRLRGQDGPDRYDGKTTPHDHLFCRMCGAVIDLPPSTAAVNAEAMRRVAKEQGVLVEGHQLNYIGVCRDCVGGPTQ